MKLSALPNRSIKRSLRGSLSFVLHALPIYGPVLTGLLTGTSCQSADFSAPEQNLDPAPEIGLLGPRKAPASSEEEAAEESIKEYKLKRLNRDLQRSITEDIS